jgi:hypothetical protein
MLALLNWRVWAAIGLAVILAFSHLTAYRHGKQSVQEKWDAAKVATERAVQEQAQANRDLQRQAELKYVVRRDAQDRFLVTTVKEIEHAAAPMASCPVPPDVVRLLNAANDCAGSDSPASCGADGQVPETR